MRKKIEVTSDEWHEAETTPAPAPDAEAPEFGDHVNPAESLKTTRDGTPIEPPRTMALPRISWRFRPIWKRRDTRSRS